MGKKQNKERLEQYVINADRREVIEKYCGYALQYYRDGLGVEYIEQELQEFEDKEKYLPCAGIKKALDLIKEGMVY